MIYFWWTANFGVVPLLAFSFFLLLPDFLDLFLRTIFVFFVREPIKTPKVFSKIRHIYVSFMKSSVKILLLLVLFFSHSLWAQEGIFLGKGEQKSFKLLKLDKFSIGNKEVLGHSYQKGDQEFMIKGKSIGFSDLIVWQGDKKQIFHVYVTDKRQQLKNEELKQILIQEKIEYKLEGNYLRTYGKLNNIHQYLVLQKLLKEKNEKLLVRSSLSLELRNKLIAKIYDQIMSEGYYQIECHNEVSIQIECSLYNSDENLKTKLEVLKAKYFVDFVESNNSQKAINYKIRMKIVQFERLDGEEFSLGLSQLQSLVGGVFDSGARSLIENNIIFLANNNIKVSTLAEPETVLQMNKEAIIQVGLDITFNSFSQAGQNFVAQNDWKFAGLKIKLRLKNQHGKPSLFYQSEITSPDSNAIKGSKESSSLYLDFDKPIHLFKIAFRTVSSQKQSLPILGSIPLLGKIFQSSNSRDNYKHIYGYLVMSK